MAPPPPLDSQVPIMSTPVTKILLVLANSIKKYPLEPLFGRILTPLERFLRRTTAGGIVLVLTTIAALVIASGPGGPAFHHFWEQPLVIALGDQFRLLAADPTKSSPGCP